MSCINRNEAGTTDIREALYLMSQNPPYKFVRLETYHSRSQFKFTPFFTFIFEGNDIEDARIRYLGNESCDIDLSKFKVLAEEIENYMKSLEDYSI
jgi:hypothetical protein